jgi:hypothetical protein
MKFDYDNPRAWFNRFMNKTDKYLVTPLDNLVRKIGKIRYKWLVTILLALVFPIAVCFLIVLFIFTRIIKIFAVFK